MPISVSCKSAPYKNYLAVQFLWLYGSFHAHAIAWVNVFYMLYLQHVEQFLLRNGGGNGKGYAQCGVERDDTMRAIRFHQCNMHPRDKVFL